MEPHLKCMWCKFSLIIICWKLYLAPLANKLFQYGYHLKCKGENQVYMYPKFIGEFFWLYLELGLNYMATMILQLELFLR